MISKVIATDDIGRNRCTFASIEAAKNFYGGVEHKSSERYFSDTIEDILKEGRHIYMYVGSIIEREVFVPAITTTKIVLEDIIS